MSNMTVSHLFDRCNIEKEKDQKVNLMVSLTAPHVEIDGVQRPPLNLSVAIDVSGSMQGKKLDNAKDSVVRLINHLSPQDRLSIVAFDNNVKRVSEPLFASSENKNELIRKVSALRVCGSTNIQGAVEEMFEMLAVDYPEKKEETIHRAILFTDGNANVGIQDYSGLVKLVDKRPGHISLSTFGYGDDHDEELLSGMAKTGKGNSFYVKGVTDCAEFFGLELGGLLKTFAKNIKLRLIPESGVSVNRILNDFAVSVINQGQEHKVDKVPEKLQVLLDDTLHDEIIVEVDDMYGDETRHIVAEVNLPASGVSEWNILRGVLTFENINSKQDESEEFEASVTVCEPDEVTTEPNNEVMEQVILLDSAQAQYDARVAAEMGNIEDASSILRNFRSNFVGTGTYDASESLQALGTSLEGLDNQLKTEGMSKGLSKNIMYCSASVGRGRSMISPDSADMNAYGFNASEDLTAYANSFAADDDDTASEPDVKQSTTVDEEKKDS